MSDARLYIGNLPFQITEAEIREFLAAAGTVKSMNLIMDKLTGKSRGFAFVDMTSFDEAQKAVDLFNNKEFQGRSLNVTIARPREDRPPRSGGMTNTERP